MGSGAEGTIDTIDFWRGWRMAQEETAVDEKNAL
jgi:hypothetical protein